MCMEEVGVSVNCNAADVGVFIIHKQLFLSACNVYMYTTAHSITQSSMYRKYREEIASSCFR